MFSNLQFGIFSSTGWSNVLLAFLWPDIPLIHSAPSWKTWQTAGTDGMRHWYIGSEVKPARSEGSWCSPEHGSRGTEKLQQRVSTKSQATQVGKGYSQGMSHLCRTTWLLRQRDTTSRHISAHDPAIRPSSGNFCFCFSKPQVLYGKPSSLR